MKIRKICCVVVLVCIVTFAEIAFANMTRLNALYAEQHTDFQLLNVRMMI